MEKIYSNEIIKAFPIFQAVKDGKTIQTIEEMGYWCDLDLDEDGLSLETLINSPRNYRIKPEQKYRPFKDGDIVVVDKNKEMNLSKIIAIYNDGDILLGFNSYAYLNVSLEKLSFCSKVLVCGRTPRLASEEENQQLFDALAKEGKRWNPDTKLFEDYFSCVGNMWRHCIPYNEETKHLLGTTDEWKGGK